ncbi:MAG: hypothetical protein J6X22_00615 [Muribaculaceae bacterium]|nr:hypothetical protein [Muribaculaceae bacterium]
MKKIFYICSLLVVLVTLSSCGNKDNGIYPFQEETKYLTVRLQGSDKWSIINVENGDIVAKNAISGIPSAVHEDMFYVYDNETARINYYNVADCSKPVNSKPYCSATSFNGGYAIACLPGEDLQVIDKNCQTVKKLPPSINSASMFLGDLAIVKDDRGLTGFVDTKGDTVIGPHLGLANAFLFDDAALVSESQVADTTAVSSLVVINKKGEKLFDFDSDKYLPINRYFINGTLKVMQAEDQKIVYLDKKGKETTDTLAIPKKIKEVNYRDVKHVGKDRYMVIKGDRMGLVDANNDTLIGIKYNGIINITPDRFIVAQDSVMMIVDEKGKQVGNAKFVDFVNGNNFEEAAGRGYVNPAKVAATLLQLFDKDAVFNVRKGGTLMEINQAVGMNPDNYVGATELTGPLPPLILTYHFDREIASLKAGAPSASDSIATASQSSAQFNYNAVVRGVTLQYPVRECAPGTEEEILQLITQEMGKKGFGINDDGTFTSDAGCVVVMGYEKGVFLMNYYFNAADVKPLQRVGRTN